MCVWILPVVTIPSEVVMISRDQLQQCVWDFLVHRVPIEGVMISRELLYGVAINPVSYDMMANMIMV